MITEYKDICGICGARSSEIHHLVFGRGLRPLADSDGLTLPVCGKCHKEIHYNSVASQLSKILGQVAYEAWYMSDFGDAETLTKTARESFRTRYGRSYL